MIDLETEFLPETRLLMDLFLVGCGENLAAVILAAIRADAMRTLHLAAIRAGDEMIEADGVVRAPLVAAGFRDFSLGNCTHDVSSFNR
jgi:hypothetical protein